MLVCCLMLINFSLIMLQVTETGFAFKSQSKYNYKALWYFAPLHIVFLNDAAVIVNNTSFKSLLVCVLCACRINFHIWRFSLCILCSCRFSVFFWFQAGKSYKIALCLNVKAKSWNCPSAKISKAKPVALIHWKTCLFESGFSSVLVIFIQWMYIPSFLPPKGNLTACPFQRLWNIGRFQN